MFTGNDYTHIVNNFSFSLSLPNQVSWMRSRDLRILTIGKTRYTGDPRFSPLHEEGNDVWALKIRDVRREDSGDYECQVSFHDDVEKKMKLPVTLLVLGECVWPQEGGSVGGRSLEWKRRRGPRGRRERRAMLFSHERSREDRGGSRERGE